MKFLLRLCSSLLIFIMANEAPSKAQSITVSIRDSATKEHLPYATIEMHATLHQKDTATYLTDKEGDKTLTSLHGEAQLTISYIGYSQKTVQIAPPFDGRLVIIYLVADAKALTELKIIEKPSIISQLPGGYVYNVDQTTADINVNTGQLLKKLPGMAVEQNGDLSLQGKPISVYIDGKPTLMSGAELTRYLSTLNLQDVKNIKVLLNPPANYEGSGGSIVDITMNKNFLHGISTRADANVATHDKYGAGISMTYKTAMYTGRYSVTYDHSNSYSHSGYTQFNKGAPDSAANYSFNSNIKNEPGNNVNVTLNNDLSISKRNTLGLTFKYNYFDNGPMYTNSTLGVSDNNEVLQQQQIFNRQDQSHSNIYFIDLNDRTILGKKGASLTIDTYYWLRNAGSSYNYTNDVIGYYPPGDQITEDVQNQSTQQLSIKSAGAAYAQPLNKYMTLLAGGKVNLFLIDGSYLNQIYDDSLSKFQTDPTQTYDLRYRENVYAGYVSMYGTVKKLQYSAGLRGEQTDLGLTTTQPDSAFNKTDHFFDLLPSVGFTYTLSKHYSIGLSFARRIFRVSYSQLNPIDYRVDPSTVMQGNPALTPSTTDNVSLTFGYHPNTKHTYTLTASYLQEHNPYTWFTLPDSTPTTFVEEPLNYRQWDYITVGLNTSQTLTKWFSLTGNLLATRQIYDLGNLNLPNPQSVTSFRVSLSADFTYWKNAVFEIYGNLKTKSTTPFGTGASYHYVDLSTSKRFLHDLLLVTLTCNDVFNINESKYENNSPYYNNAGYLKNETRIGRLSVSYTLGRSRKNSIKDYTPQEDTRFKN